MVVLLFVPKLLATALVLRNGRLRRAHGGTVSILASVLLENLFSVLLAPIMMLSQTGFVASILMGRNSGWKSQRRDEGGSGWKALVSRFMPHTILGVAAAAFVWKFLPEYVWWLSPVMVGPVLALPLAAMTESVRVGQLAQRYGLFVAPWETGAAPLVEKVQYLVRSAEGRQRLAA
ncbi:MAG: glucan biosynthesis glucosyltransferase H, partial [Alphaproteobacteria bacterium]|nr:glucan biosynthesis glucosyltransferase H [Alphaproteobacteria bacterium]